MATELLIASNPSRRKKRRLSPKARAAAIRNLKKARRARKPGRRRNPVGMYLAPNPKRRRKARRAKGGVRYLKRRRNPVSLRKFSPRALLSHVMPALVGGGGAVANDLIYATALRFMPDAMPFKAQLTDGPLRHVGKALSAVALSMVAGFVLPRRIAEQMGTGALTVVGYNVVREAVTRFAPGVGMGMYLEPASGLGWAGAGWNPAYGPGATWGAPKAGGLAAYLQPGNRNGNNGLTVQPQFKTTAGSFGASPSVYADELEA